MLDDDDLAPAIQHGLIFWVPLTSSRQVAWLRSGVLLLLLPLLVSLAVALSVDHAPDAAVDALASASFLVILIRVWTLLLDLLYRLDSRERRYVLAYLIAFGLTVVLALLVRYTALLLDTLFSPTGHFFAIQGFFAVLLTLFVAPITLSILHRESPGYYWQRLRLSDEHWARAEEPLRRILARHPHTLRPALLLLECLLRQDKREEAWGLVKYLTTQHPQAWGTWAALGTLALEEEQWEKAVSALKQSNRLAPRSAKSSVRLNLGLALLGAGRLDAGRLELERAVRHGLPPHMRQFGWFMLMRIGQVQQDPGLMMYASNRAKGHPREGRAFLDWYATVDRSHSPTFAEDLYEALDWTRHLLGVRVVI